MNLSQEDNRHAHLLKPIRELAANWDINIASELEEYLEVLESVTFSVEGSGSVNFAEAALLVQGSAHVYSKKVEYLHQLVYQALDVIADRKQRQARAAGRNGVAEDDDVYDEEEMFLRLDDVLEEGKDIDMDDSGSPQVTRPMRAPAVLLALDSTGDGYGDGAGCSFRITSCAVHQSGALLIEPSGADGYDHMLRRVAARTSPSGAFRPPPVDPNAAAAAPGEAASCQAPTPPGEANGGAAADDRQPDNEYDGGDAGGYGDNDDAGGMEWAGDVGPSPGRDSQGGAAGWAAEQQQQQQPGDYEEVEEDHFDPWAPLDQHDDSGMAKKPFRKAKRLPKFKRPPPPALPSALGAVPSAVPGKLAFPEFQPALQRLQQAKRAAAATAQRATAQRRSAFVAPPAEEAQPDDGDNDYDGGDDWDDGVGADPLSDDDNDYMPVPDAAEPASAWDAEAPSQAAANPTYEDLCRAHVDAIMAAAAAADVQTELAARVARWRQRVQPVIDAQDARESFDMRVYGERILARLSELSLDGEAAAQPPPHLQPAPQQQQQKRPAQRQKGRKGAAAAPLPQQQQAQAPPTAPLSAAVGHPEQWQVSRLFAASLQLVNNGNIDFEMPDGGEVPGGGSAPRLLVHSLQLQDRQADYRPPSQQQKGDARGMELDENISGTVVAAA